MVFVFSCSQHLLYSIAEWLAHSFSSRKEENQFLFSSATPTSGKNKASWLQVIDYRGKDGLTTNVTVQKMWLNCYETATKTNWFHVISNLWRVTYKSELVYHFVTCAEIETPRNAWRVWNLQRKSSMLAGNSLRRDENHESAGPAFVVQPLPRMRGWCETCDACARIRERK